MKRLFHWGPIITLIIIKFESFTTLYYTSLWLKFQLNDLLSIINYSIYYLLLILILTNFFSSIFIGPGYVPLNWEPLNIDDKKYLQYCLQCNGYKAPRSHHCSKCKRCILKMDHHCPWINNCCGYRNQRYFFNFLLTAVIGSIHTIILSIITLYRAIKFIPNNYNNVHNYNNYVHLKIIDVLIILFSICMAVGIVFAVGFILYLQTKIIIQNRTSIENWIIEKSKNRKRDKPFIFPYDLGFYKNIKQVLWDSLDDGIEYPIRNDCHKYALTYEQLQQKKDKLNNSSIYRIIRSYNGNYFPLFSQGLRVCITFPLNDDPRLKININDEILVTHRYKNWFYGKKLNTNEKIPLKGWFPIQCATLLLIQQQQSTTNIDGDLRDNDEQNFDNKKYK